jgi:hypothetical protein
MEMACKDGMDIINISLGNSMFSLETPEAVWASKLVDMGKIVVASQGILSYNSNKEMMEDQDYGILPLLEYILK